MKKKTPTPDFQKWEKWQQSIKQIDDELQSLDRARRVYFRFCEILEKNSKLRAYWRDTFFDWLSYNYCIRLGMGIRRLVDKCSSKLNIYKLLLDIQVHTLQINVDNYAKYLARQKLNETGQKPSKHHANHYRELALRAFKKAFCRRRSTLLPKDLNKDIQSVEKVKAKIEKYVDENWAHMGNRNVPAPTTKDAHKCLDTLLNIYNKYSLLLCKGPFLPLGDSEIFLRWEAPFLIPWIG